jgi:hypothetical protein
MLYLHEIIDIIGDGQRAYLETVAERAAHSEAAGLSRFFGAWRVIGSTGRWPRVVNLWEMDGWAHWSQTLERQFLPESQDPTLAPWWSRAAQWRSGGFDRILEPASFAPTRDALREDGLKAWVCVHTIQRLRPGAAATYLGMLGTTLLPLLESRGLALMGAYQNALQSDEVVTLWAAPTFAMLCELYARRRDDPQLQAWSRRAQELRLSSETTWLVPSPACFFHPHAGRSAGA